MDYASLKLAHIALAAISISGFILRWTWRTRQSPLACLRVTRILPHVIDTLFLASGILLAVTIGQYPPGAVWLTAKITGLVVYILLGMLAMSNRLSNAGRRAVFVVALFTFSWIVSVALSKSPAGFFGW